MIGPVQTVRNLWWVATGHKAPAALAIVLFDPCVQKPHDLDGPFF